MLRWQLTTILLMVVTGCGPRTIVRPNPAPHDTGIRYYRPKPYLLLQPTPVPVKEDPGTRQDKYVQISLEYLPDFSEEYSINVRSGLGINNTSVKLANGWNLTEINQELDSQFDENVNALANLIKSAAPGGIVPTEGQRMRGPSMKVPATNVPLGYYESVISRGPDGKKRLYGWRYVGFYPFSPCPVETDGLACEDCHTSPLYGLVFHDGVMTFKLIHDIADRRPQDATPVRAREALEAPLPPEVIQDIADRASAAANVLSGSDNFTISVNVVRPHVVFTIAAMADLRNFTDEEFQGNLTESLNVMIQEMTGQPYIPILRVVEG